MAYNKADFLAGLAAGRNVQSWPVLEAGGQFFAFTIEIVNTLTFTFYCTRNGGIVWYRCYCSISWGDGTTTDYLNTPAPNENITHTYRTAGRYCIIVRYQKTQDEWPQYLAGAFSLAQNLVVSVDTPFPSVFSNVTDCNSLFSLQKKLVSIPTNLFKSFASKVTTFSLCFLQCSALNCDLNGLFNGCTAAVDMGAIFWMSGISSIPDDLFRDCVNAKYFNATFSSCYNLTSIPNTLFDNLPNASEFSTCFNYCYNVVSSVPELWVSYPNAIGTNCFDGCINAENFYSVPASWGGPA